MSQPNLPDDEWAAPRWVGYDKHFPVPGAKWTDVVRSTGEPEAVAKYRREMTPNRIEEVEMATVAGEGHALPQKKQTIRAFWRKFDDVIGASKGEETNYIYVEWGRSGDVHGRPMTKAELKKKGMSS